MHEYAKGLKFPILDVEEIVRLRFLGYDQMKVVSNLNEANGENGLGDFGGRHPDTFTDFFFKTKQWSPVERVLRNGIKNARNYHHDWFDFHMRLNTSRNI